MRKRKFVGLSTIEETLRYDLVFCLGLLLIGF